MRRLLTMLAAAAVSAVMLYATYSYCGTGAVRRVVGKAAVTSLVDSTSFTLENGDTDTTVWLEADTKVGGICCVAGHPMVHFFFGLDNMASGDSIGYVVQYSVDKSNIFSATKSYMIYSALNPYFFDEPVSQCGSNATYPSYGFPYYRVLISDDDATRTSAWVNCNAYLGYGYELSN